MMHEMEVMYTIEEEPENPVASRKIKNKEGGGSCSRSWTNAIVSIIHKPVLKVLHTLSDWAATHPIFCIVAVIITSLALVGIGFVTNFHVVLDEDVLWTPFNSRPVQHKNWIQNESGFPATPGYIYLVIHADGDSVLDRQGVKKVFQAMEVVQTTPGYESVCIPINDELISDAPLGCQLSSITNFWGGNYTLFTEQIKTDEDAIAAMSADVFPDGTPVARDQIFGKWEADTISSLLTYSEAFVVVFYVVDNEDGAAFEKPVLDDILNLREEWAAKTRFRLEISAMRSFADEFERAIVDDIPLMPAAFIIMSLFTTLVFAKPDKVRSRALLGFGAVVCVLLSIMSGYGLLFIIGVPFTSITQILPFIMFGIGLDDAFIISGEYNRTDPTKEPAQRIHDTVEHVGASIFLTTITSTLAFALGCSSSIPTVYWLCLYAFPTILIDFVYQLTFFVALLVLDERRLQSRRVDCCLCIVATNDRPQEEDEDQEETEGGEMDRFMTWYAEKLLHPAVKAVVLAAFAALFAGCAYNASRLTQEFDFTEVLPSDSYLADLFKALDDHTVRSVVAPMVYFRFLDQSDPHVQQQMENYVNQIVELDEVSKQPDFFWLRDFHNFLDESKNTTEGLPFNEQVDQFLQDPVYRKLYLDDIVLNDEGDITSSRLEVSFDQIELDDVKDLIEALENQRDLTKAQPANQGCDDWAMFTYHEEYNAFEFYSVTVQELFLTTIVGVFAVSFVGLLFIPHWSAILYVAPMISILYIDLLGVMRFAGLHVNAVSYITMVMSIGLMVDFVLHTILRYFEAKGSRSEKVSEMLRTMGSSILTGGISTFLGVIPLAFSTSDIFKTIFITFLALVTLGIGHCLILLPVILSMVGTSDSIDIVRPTRTAKDSFLSDDGRYEEEMIVFEEERLEI